MYWWGSLISAVSTFQLTLANVVTVIVLLEWKSELIGPAIFFFGFIKLIKELFRYKRYRFPSHLASIAALGAAFVNGGSKGYIGEHVYAETIAFFLVLAFFSICYKYYMTHARGIK